MHNIAVKLRQTPKTKDCEKMLVFNPKMVIMPESTKIIMLGYSFLIFRFDFSVFLNEIGT